ncbi:hypothetical protein PASLES2_16250 [Pseudomonas aeruginosa]
MNNKALLGILQIVLSISAAQAAMAAEEKGEGFIEGSSPEHPQSKFLLQP